MCVNYERLFDASYLADEAKLGTFKPGMMVKEFDTVCFEKEIGVVHGPVETQFGSHLILITRRYEGEDEKK